jgi:hypothetical protein
MSSTAYAQALRVSRSILGSLVRHHQSADTLRGNLHTFYANRSLDRARDAVQHLTTIVHQKAGYDKAMADLQIIEQTSLTGKISKEDLKSRTGPALQRLRKAAKLMKSKDFVKNLKNFPKFRHKIPSLSRDYHLLFAGLTPTREEVAGFLPAIAQQAQVPIEFLEKATGLTASYVLDGDLVLQMPFGAVTELPYPEVSFTEAFQTVEPRS